MYADDTIAAIATPPGPGGVGIVRVSGSLCTGIVDRIFVRRSATAEWRSHHLYQGQIVDRDGGVLDQALAVRMAGPHSYTGEDVLELHCHGSPVLLRRVLARVLDCGARLAEPGEFTKRAFLNGRLDLAQAEAVIDLVRARTTAAAALATQQLTGHLSNSLNGVRSDLIRLKALLEAQIDFSEEDVVVEKDELLAVLDQCLEPVKVLIETYSQGHLVREGLQITIVGKPNVGKSSLLNALLGRDRAIVTPVPGTTRDAIDESADFDGIPVILSDTAGLRRRERADAVERLGMERTTAKMAQSEVLLVVLDGSAPLDGEDHAVLKQAADVPQIVVLNKSDLPKRITADALRNEIGERQVATVSAKEGSGLGELRRSVVTLVTGGATMNGAPVLSNLRHADALEKACVSLTFARESIRAARSPDLIAVDVQDAIDYVGAITGAVTSEEVLDRIFGEFCIGK